MTDRPAPADGSAPQTHLGLSGKLLVLTILFVMMAEVLIYVPSIATFRRNWLNDRLSAAYTAALVLEATGLPERDVPDYIEVNHTKMTAKLVRIPHLTEVPYPVQMEPHLVVEFYSR